MARLRAREDQSAKQRGCAQPRLVLAEAFRPSLSHSVSVWSPFGTAARGKSRRASLAKEVRLCAARIISAAQFFASAYFFLPPVNCCTAAVHAACVLPAFQGVRSRFRGSFGFPA